MKNTFLLFGALLIFTALVPTMTWARIDDEKPVPPREIRLEGDGIVLNLVYSVRNPDGMKIIATVGDQEKTLEVNSVDTYRDGGSLMVHLDHGSKLWVPVKDGESAELTGPSGKKLFKKIVVEDKTVQRKVIDPKKDYGHYTIGMSANGEVTVIVGFPKKVKVSARDLDHMPRSTKITPPALPDVIVIRKGQEPYQLLVESVEYYRDGGSVDLRLENGDITFIPNERSKEKMTYKAKGGSAVEFFHRNVVPTDPLLGADTVRIDFTDAVNVSKTCKAAL